MNTRLGLCSARLEYYSCAFHLRLSVNLSMWHVMYRATAHNRLTDHYCLWHAWGLKCDKMCVCRALSTMLAANATV